MTPEKSRDRRSLWIEPGREQLAAFWYNAGFKESISGAKKDPLRKIGSARVQWAADRMHGHTGTPRRSRRAAPDPRARFPYENRPG